VFGPTPDTEGFFDMDEAREAPPCVQASDFGLFRHRKRYHTPLNMMNRPRTPNTEPSAMANMDLDSDSGDEVALEVEEATTGKVEVGNREEDVEELTFVTVV
jgi:hypothetical protein